MSYEDDEETERFLEMLAHMEARATEAGINDAEASLAAMPATTDLPMPNTAHPAYADLGPVVRSYEHDRDMIRIPRFKRAGFSEPDEIPVSALETTILTRHKAVGGAPFVGDARYQRACYVWSVWMDSAGRYIATDAWLVRS